MRKGFCHHCGTELEFVERVFRTDTCPKCGSDVYCCLNCRNYDDSAPNECREPQSEKITVKDRRNFCDYFELGDKRVTSDKADRAARSRKKLEELFKK